MEPLIQEFKSKSGLPNVLPDRDEAPARVWETDGPESPPDLRHPGRSPIREVPVSAHGRNTFPQSCCSNMRCPGYTVCKKKVF